MSIDANLSVLGKYFGWLLLIFIKQKPNNYLKLLTINHMKNIVSMKHK